MRKTKNFYPKLNFFKNPASLFFISIIFLELIFILYLIIERRIPRGHDGFQFFTVQYYFLNHVVVYDQIPQWFPYMTHGTVSIWWYFVQSSIIQNLWFLLAPLLKTINFIPLFYLGMLFDELVLLVGLWLLTKRYFSSSLTIFFVCLSALSSTMWIDQPWWNFKIFYALPLIINFLHEFLETAKWRYLFIAGHLCVFQMFGNLPYMIPATTLFLSIYFLGYSWKNTAGMKVFFKSLKINLACMATLVSIGLALYFSDEILQFGSDSIINYNRGRYFDGTVPLFHFLNYAGHQNQGKWFELLLGISPSMDRTLYMGIIPFLLVIVGIDRKSIYDASPIWLSIFLLTLISMGTILSTLTYYTWPFMKYFRHLGFISIYFKILLFILAGYGFEKIVLNRGKNKILKPLIFTLLISIIGLIASLSFDFRIIFRLLSDVIYPDPIPSAFIWDTSFHTSRLLTILLVLIVSGFLFSKISRTKSKKTNKILLCSFFTVLLFDIYTYKYTHAQHQTYSIPKKSLDLTRFQDLPYAPIRIKTNQRVDFRSKLMNKINFIQSYHYGASYWTNATFAFVDEITTKFRTDHFLKYYDQYLRSIWGQKPDNPNALSKALEQNWKRAQRIKYPLNRIAPYKMSGHSKMKLQVFENAYKLPDIIIAKHLSDPTFLGDILFLSDLNADQTQKINLSSDERLSIPISIVDFNSDKLTVELDMKQKTGWLYYSDVWHPLWRASLNNKPVPIFKANIAYKAVQLNTGKNLVTFEFGSEKMKKIFWVMTGISLLWFLVILTLSARIIFSKRS